jgi:amino acid permease
MALPETTRASGSPASLPTTSSTTSAVFTSDLESAGPSIDGDHSPEKIVDVRNRTRSPAIPKRLFKKRHIQMMAFGTYQYDGLTEGNAIGNGLFISSGKAIYFGGPVSAFIAYLSMGSVLYAVLVILKLT